MSIIAFEDMEVWKHAKELTLGIYESLKECKDRSFKDQLQRASVSIMNNIAEGFERSTLPDKQKFFIIAKGSCGEARSMLHLIVPLGYMDSSKAEHLYQTCISISKMLSKLISNIKY